MIGQRATLVSVVYAPSFDRAAVESVDELGACVAEGECDRAVLQKREVGFAERTREHRIEIGLDYDYTVGRHLPLRGTRTRGRRRAANADVPRRQVR